MHLADLPFEASGEQPIAELLEPVHHVLGVSPIAVMAPVDDRRKGASAGSA
jgi:hypothetical protein